MRIHIEQTRPLKINTSMGGKDKEGNTYGVNNRYLTKNGRAMLPVMENFISPDGCLRSGKKRF